MTTGERGEASSAGVALDVLENLLEGCQVIGFDWRYLYINATLAAETGRSKEELVGRTMMECFPGIEETAMFGVLRRCMSARTYDTLDNQFTFPDGKKMWFELRFIPVPEGICVLSLDVTKEKLAEAALLESAERMQQAQKMDAIGRLAGGLAHDFNNLLSAIISYGELIRDAVPPDHPVHADATEVLVAGERAAQLTKQLLAFGRKQLLAPKVLDLNLELARMERMLERVAGEHNRLEIVAAPHLANVKVDPSQLVQVVMNLVLNARDAMPNGGRLTLETADVDEAQVRAHLHDDTLRGPHVMLAVKDTGLGMDKETQARIFEPFFTTKALGKGTGLGLAMVHGIVTQSGGHVAVTSEPGKGTAFTVYFPRTDEVGETTTASPESAAVEGTETILLVEDEAQVRDVARAILARHGYRVLATASAAEAILAHERHPARIHLLLTDVVMPDESGPQLAGRLTPLRPDMRVLFMSGYTDDAVIREAVMHEDVPFLPKPITPASLTRKVREVLDAPK
jgi:two-component system, cell cycle sensor histidine kinase and response regulator CckA